MSKEVNHNSSEAKSAPTLASSLEAYLRQRSTIKTFVVQDDVLRCPDGTLHIRKDRRNNLLPVLCKTYGFLIKERGGAVADSGAAMELCNMAADFLLGNKLKGRETPCFGLMMQGFPGTGKTTLMNAMHKSLVFLYQPEDDIKIRTMCVKVSMLSEWQKNDKDQLKRAKNCDILFLDDIGFSGESEVVNEYGNKSMPFIDLIEHRYDRRMKTVATTNLCAEELKARYGDRVYSRFCEMFYTVPFVGDDYRKLKR